MADVEIPDPTDVREKSEDPRTRTIALAVAVYAVVLAVSSFGGSNAAKEMMLVDYFHDDGITGATMARPGSICNSASVPANASISACTYAAGCGGCSISC